MKDYLNYTVSDCCGENVELRYKVIKSHSLINNKINEYYVDKLTGDVIYDVTSINLCELIAPKQEEDNLYKKLDPLKLDPLYTPSSFNKPRIENAEETKNWELVNSYDKIGNKHGRWFLNGVNLTRYDIYNLYENQSKK